jgi:hypothetical protein
MNKQELEDKLPWDSTTRPDAGIREEWYDLVSKLDDDLKAIDSDYTVVQVKEKFGGLRYYAYPSGDDKTVASNQAFYDRINQAEVEAQ